MTNLLLEVKDLVDQLMTIFQCLLTVMFQNIQNGFVRIWQTPLVSLWRDTFKRQARERENSIVGRKVTKAVTNKRSRK